MTLRQDTWTRRPGTYIEVQTNKRSYGVIGAGRVTWERGEKVVSIEVKAKDQAAGASRR